MFNLFRIANSRNLYFDWPIFLTGRGYIRLNGKVEVGRNSSFSLSKKARLVLGKSTIGSNAVISCSDRGVFTASDGLVVDNYSRIFVNSEFTFGSDIQIATRCDIFSRERNCYGRLWIGNGTHIGDGTIIDTSDDVEIGKEVAIGPYSIIYTHSHDFTDGTPAAWKGKVKRANVVIMDGTWIGSRVIILPGTIVGRRSVIAAGSVVTANVPDNVLVAGSPAKFVKTLI